MQYMQDVWSCKTLSSLFWIMGVKIREPATSVIKLAPEPTSQSFTRKRKQDWRMPTKEDEELIEECDKINTACMEKQSRLPRSIGEDPYLAEFGGLISGIGRLRKSLRK